jgi:hypothetical protein
LRSAKFKLLEEDNSLSRDEEYLSDILASDPNSCNEWELIASIVRASIAASSLADAADKMAQNVIARRDRYKARALSLKKTAQNALIQLDQTKAEYPDCGIYRQAPRKRLTIYNSKEIPEEYKYTPDVVIDKEKLRADLAGGKDIPGARLEDGDEVVVIRTT